MKKKLSGLILILLVALFGQSCVVALRGNHAFLSEEASVTMAEVQLVTPIIHQSVDLGYHLGVGQVDFSKTDIDASETVAALGISCSYFFSKGRLQPLVNLETMIMAPVEDNAEAM